VKIGAEMLKRAFASAALLLFGASFVFAENITFWAMGEEGMRIGKSEIMQRFEKDNPGIKVIVQTIPWDAAREKLLTSVIGGIPPDVCQLGTTWMSEFSAMDSLLDLRPYFASSSVVKDTSFYPSSWNSCVYHGRYVGVPWYVDTRVLFYRTDLLRKAGFNNPPKNWDELRAVSLAIKNKKLSKYAISLPTSNFEVLAMFVWQNGGNILNADNTAPIVTEKPFMEALEYYTTFFDDSLSPVEDAADVNLFNAFKTGFYSMFVSGPWMLNLVDRYCGPEFRDKWNVAVLPGKKEPTSFVGGANLVVFKDSRHHDAAWKLVEYLSRPDVQVEWFKVNNNLPSVVKAWDDPYFSDKPMVRVFGEQLKHTMSPPNIPEWEQITGRIGRHMESVIVAKEEFLPQMKAADADIRKILANRVSSTGHAIVRWIVSGSAAIAAILIFMIVAAFRKHKKAPGSAPRSLEYFGKYVPPLIFIAPVVILLAVFLFLPVIISFIMSLTDWDVYTFIPGTKMAFIGFDNYKELFGDPLFWKSLRNTMYYVVVGAPLSVIVSLMMALILNEQFIRFRNFFRLGYFLPVVTTIVAVCVIWRWIYNHEYGLMNYVLGLLNLPKQNWLESTQLAMPSLILMSVWKNFGYNMVIFLAGLQAIPEQLYEAARIDGAGKLQIFWYVTFPSLAPTTFFVVLMTLIGSFQFFAEPYIMTKGGPMDSTISIVMYMYAQGFKYLRMGYASALAYVLFGMIFLVTLFQMWMRNIEKEY